MNQANDERDTSSKRVLQCDENHTEEKEKYKHGEIIRTCI